MTYRIVLSPKAKRQLDIGIPEKAVPALIEFILGPLAEKPFVVGKRMRRERTGTWSAHYDVYRVIYTINNRLVTVTVLDIDLRGKILNRRGGVSV